MRAHKERAQNCYADLTATSLTTDEDNNDFLETMIMDGVFLVKLFLKKEDKTPKEDVDEIFKSRWILPVIVHDVLLVENQIPFFVLHKLLEMTEDPPVPHSKLIGLVKDFFNLSQITDIDSKTEINHVLHFLRNHLKSSKIQTISFTKEFK
ncbi:GDSL esterase/lipase CPRD49 [Fagus crenata]